MASIGNSSSITAAKTMTVEDFISLGSSDEVTYYNYSLLEYLNGYEMFITSILYDYEDEISDAVILVALTEEERAKYRYKPYLFAYDIYGATEYKFIIMMLNGIIDPKEFDLQKIKVISKSTLNNILSRILSVNESFMNSNRAQLKKDFKNAENGNTIWTEDY